MTVLEKSTFLGTLTFRTSACSTRSRRSPQPPKHKSRPEARPLVDFVASYSPSSVFPSARTPVTTAVKRRRCWHIRGGRRTTERQVPLSRERTGQGTRDPRRRRRQKHVACGDSLPRCSGPVTALDIASKTTAQPPTTFRRYGTADNISAFLSDNKSALNSWAGRLCRGM